MAEPIRVGIVVENEQAKREMREFGTVAKTEMRGVAQASQRVAQTTETQTESMSKSFRGAGSAISGVNAGLQLMGNQGPPAVYALGAAAASVATGGLGLLGAAITALTAVVGAMLLQSDDASASFDRQADSADNYAESVENATKQLEEFVNAQEELARLQAEARISRFGRPGDTGDEALLRARREDILATRATAQGNVQRLLNDGRRLSDPEVQRLMSLAAESLMEAREITDLLARIEQARRRPPSPSAPGASGLDARRVARARLEFDNALSGVPTSRLGRRTTYGGVNRGPLRSDAGFEAGLFADGLMGQLNLPGGGVPGPAPTMNQLPPSVLQLIRLGMGGITGGRLGASGQGAGTRQTLFDPVAMQRAAESKEAEDFYRSFGENAAAGIAGQLAAATQAGEFDQFFDIFQRGVTDAVVNAFFAAVVQKPLEKGLGNLTERFLPFELGGDAKDES